MLRSSVIKACNLDIACLCETFLRDEQTVEFLVIAATVSQYLNEHSGILVG